jgi:hypothetical protein
MANPKEKEFVSNFFSFGLALMGLFSSLDLEMSTTPVHLCFHAFICYGLGFISFFGFVSDYGFGVGNDGFCLSL